MKIRNLFFLLLAVIAVLEVSAGHGGRSVRKIRRESFPRQRSGPRYFDTTNAIEEMIRLQASYSGVDHLSFDVGFVWVISSDSYVDSLPFIAKYKVNGNNYYVWYNDSVTSQTQNDQYHVGLDTSNQELTLDRPNYFFKMITQMDIMDTIFQIQNVQGMSVMDTGSMRKISFQFYPQSLYKGLTIVYDTGTYRLRNMNSSVGFRSVLPADSAVTTNDRVNIRATFSNYQTTVFSDTVFSLNKYFTVTNGVFLFKPPYDTYTIINNTLD